MRELTPQRQRLKELCDEHRTIPHLVEAMLVRTDNPAESPLETAECLLVVEALERCHYIAQDAAAMLRITPRKFSYLVSKHLRPEEHARMYHSDQRRKRRTRPPRLKVVR